MTLGLEAKRVPSINMDLVYIFQTGDCAQRGTFPTCPSRGCDGEAGHPILLLLALRSPEQRGSLHFTKRFGHMICKACASRSYMLFKTPIQFNTHLPLIRSTFEICKRRWALMQFGILSVSAYPFEKICPCLAP